MNELTYSFIGSLRAWLHENETLLQANNIIIGTPPDLFYDGIRAQFSSDRFEAGFFIWEKRNWHLAMSDVEFVEWQVADKDPNYQIEYTHYEYATIDEMRGVLDALRDRLLLVQQGDAQSSKPIESMKNGLQ